MRPSAPPQSPSPAAPQCCRDRVGRCSAAEAARLGRVGRSVAVRLVVRRRRQPERERCSRPIRPRRSSRTSSRAPTISFWTFYLSPTFDQYIKDTIARFEATYPGVKVKWEDHQATFKDDLNNAFAAGNAPDVINLSVSEGWVSEYAGKGLLLGLDEQGPEGRQGHLLPGPLEGAAGRRRELPVPVVPGPQRRADQQGHLREGRRRPSTDFPKTIDGLPGPVQDDPRQDAAPCATIRLTVNDLLAQMVYEGNVKVLSDDGKTFTFNSPEGVAWLQMYVDMVKAGTVDNTVLDDRPTTASASTPSRPAARRSTRPARTSSARSRTSNATLYGNLGMVPAPLGKSGVAGKGLMSISVKKDTKFPNASIALAQFFTNPRSMVEFAKQVAVYPSSPSAYDDPFFSTPPTAIEDSARPLAKGIISTYADIVPTDPEQGRRQRRSSSRRSSRRCSTTSPPSRPSTDAVADGQQAPPK